MTAQNLRSSGGIAGLTIVIGLLSLGCVTSNAGSSHFWPESLLRSMQISSTQAKLSAVAGLAPGNGNVAAVLLDRPSSQPVAVVMRSDGTSEAPIEFKGHGRLRGESGSITVEGAEPIAMFESANTPGRLMWWNIHEPTANRVGSASWSGEHDFPTNVDFAAVASTLTDVYVLAAWTDRLRGRLLGICAIRGQACLSETTSPIAGGRPVVVESPERISVLVPDPASCHITEVSRSARKTTRHDLRLHAYGPCRAQANLRVAAIPGQDELVLAGQTWADRERTEPGSTYLGLLDTANGLLHLTSGFPKPVLALAILKTEDQTRYAIQGIYYDGVGGRLQIRTTLFGNPGSPLTADQFDLISLYGPDASGGEALLGAGDCVDGDPVYLATLGGTSGLIWCGENLDFTDYTKSRTEQTARFKPSETLVASSPGFWEAPTYPSVQPLSANSLEVATGGGVIRLTGGGKHPELVHDAPDDGDGIVLMRDDGATAVSITSTDTGVSYSGGKSTGTLRVPAGSMPIVSLLETHGPWLTIGTRAEGGPSAAWSVRVSGRGPANSVDLGEGETVKASCGDKSRVLRVITDGSRVRLSEVTTSSSGTASEWTSSSWRVSGAGEIFPACISPAPHRVVLMAAAVGRGKPRVAVIANGGNERSIELSSVPACWSGMSVASDGTSELALILDGVCDHRGSSTVYRVDGSGGVTSPMLLKDLSSLSELAIGSGCVLGGRAVSRSGEPGFFTANTC